MSSTKIIDFHSANGNHHYSMITTQQVETSRYLESICATESFTQSFNSRRNKLAVCHLLGSSTEGEESEVHLGVGRALHALVAPNLEETME